MDFFCWIMSDSDVIQLFRRLPLFESQPKQVFEQILIRSNDLFDSPNMCFSRGFDDAKFLFKTFWGKNEDI